MTSEDPPDPRSVLVRTEPFDRLPPTVIDGVLGGVTERRFGASEFIVREGEPSDALYLIVDGRAEVRVGDGGLPIAGLEPFDSFGELGLLSGGGTRTASVVALSPVSALRIDRASFETLLARSPELGTVIRQTADQLARADLIRQVTPFASIDADARKALARRVVPRSIREGVVVFDRGDPGTDCFLLVSGRIQLLDGRTGREMAVIGPATLFGETAVLTGASRSATAVALEDSELLSLARADLESALKLDEVVRRRVFELLRLRFRPTRAQGIQVHRKEPPEGETVAVLKDPARHRYFRLSEHGLFIWERLDGDHNVRDLTLEGLERFQAFAPQAIVQLLTRLEAGGFIRGAGLPSEAAERASWRTLPRRAVGVFTWTRELPRLDAVTDVLHRVGGKLIFTPVAQVILAAVALAGPLALVASAARATAVLRTSDASIGWALLMGFVIAAFIHDAGHALATKHYGREVRGGIGFFWLSPILFIDTSDMWLAPKRQRIVVTLAGPYAHLIAAGIAGLLTLVLPDGLALVILWELALFAYADVLLNLSPLLELDGYYLVVHLTDRPNLRRRSLAFLTQALPGALRHPSTLRGHALEVSYGIASIVFVVAITAYSIALYRLGIEPWLARVFSPEVTTAIGWTLAAVLVIATIAALVGDLQRAAEATRLERPQGSDGG